MVDKQFDYRDWQIYFSPTPIPNRDFDYTAIHMDYDGPGDDRILYGESAKELQMLIDDWHESRGE